MRKLASIQAVNAIDPIEGADAIERVRVLGWYVVCKKGDFKVGDLAVYCEIDSVLPEKPEFEFLRARKFRIKTIKLRGQVSQGILFPITILPPGKYPEDTDVTEKMGITKWEPDSKPIRSNSKLFGKLKRAQRSLPWPSFIPKTDETRVQNLGPLLEKYQGERFYVTEKLDGCSFTAYVNDGKFGVCSRNWELRRPGGGKWEKLCEKFSLRRKVGQLEYHTLRVLGAMKLGKAGYWLQKNFFPELVELTSLQGGDGQKYWEAATRYGLEQKMLFEPNNFSDNYAIQCELCGPGIQGNKYDLKNTALFLFNVFDINRQQYVGIQSVGLGLDRVPMLHYNIPMIHTIDSAVAAADAPSLLNKQIPREGIVCRTINPIYDPKYGFVSFKAINPKFLLKYE